ncbi:MAG TPA: acyltransferase [Usitatibacter sp.]|nr:acyltransferase [Usitatibacter sp.]
MKRLEALEGLRGYAAFLVFLVHSSGLIVSRLYAIDADHASIFDMPPAAAAFLFFFRSHYGVDLFFVLSGLLMADIAARRWPGTPTFLRRRALRIYPAYIASVALALGVAVWLFDRRIAHGDIAANAVFLQGFFVLDLPALNPVTWSLSYEAAFYVLVPLIALAWSRREAALRPAHVAWLLALALIAIVALAALLPGGKTIFFAYFALFVPGLAIGFLDEPARARMARRVPAAIVVLGWIAFTLAVKLELLANTQPAYFVASALACGLVVLKCCDSRSLPARIFTTRAALALGRISYSFFLVHYIVLHVLGRVIHAGEGAASRAGFAAAIYAGGLVLSVGAAWLLFQAAERFYFARPSR